MSKKQFIIESIKDFKTTGSWLPSQRFLIKDLTKPIKNNRKMLIVEFGAGEGCVTKKITERMNSHSKLITFELNKQMANLIKRKFHLDKRVDIIQDDAINIKKYMKENEVDIIISSLPLGNMGKKEVLNILKISKNILKRNGTFIQYQYLAADFLKLRKTFGNVKLSWEPLNFPPAFVYTCKN